MRYSPNNTSRYPAQDEVKVAVITDNMRAEQASQQRLNEIALVIVATSLAATAFTLLH